MALGDVGGYLSPSREMSRKEQQMNIQPSWALPQALSTLPLPILVFPEPPLLSSNCYTARSLCL